MADKNRFWINLNLREDVAVRSVLLLFITFVFKIQIQAVVLKFSF